jgi:hypothetical protein
MPLKTVRFSQICGMSHYFDLPWTKSLKQKCLRAPIIRTAWTNQCKKPKALAALAAHDLPCKSLAERID